MANRRLCDIDETEKKLTTPKKLTATDAYSTVYDQIVNGEITPGEKITEARIAEKLGLSRTPVREALRRLESDGLLVHEPHKGMMVRQLDYQSVSELYQIREVLEGTAAAWAARQISDVELSALYDMLDAQEVAKGDAVEAARLNKLFHRTLGLGAHNRYLIEMIDGLALSLTLLGRSTLSIGSREDQAILEHRRLLDAIAARDPDLAEEVAREHIRASHKARLSLLLDEL